MPHRGDELVLVRLRLHQRLLSRLQVRIALFHFTQLALVKIFIKVHGQHEAEDHQHLVQHRPHNGLR